eukprot:3061606-Amphidinium_carterae.1
MAGIVGRGFEATQARHTRTNVDWGDSEGRGSEDERLPCSLHSGWGDAQDRGSEDEGLPGSQHTDRGDAKDRGSEGA